jgi:hypothetical protein
MSPGRRKPESNPGNLRALKRRLSPRLLTLQGVSGVGISSGRLTVYLSEDLVSLRRRLEKILAHEAPGVEVALVATGPFRKHAAG